MYLNVEQCVDIKSKYIFKCLHTLYQENKDSVQIVRIEDDTEVGLVLDQSSDELAFLRQWWTLVLLIMWSGIQNYETDDVYNW